MSECKCEKCENGPRSLVNEGIDFIEFKPSRGLPENNETVRLEKTGFGDVVISGKARGIVSSVLIFKEEIPRIVEWIKKYGTDL